jgi:HK97 family phage prohead protease
MRQIIERRIAAPAAAKLSASPDAATGGYRVGGYAIRFNSPTWIGGKDGGYYEVIMPGSLDRSLREDPDLRLLMAHDPRWVMGRVKSGTLSVKADNVGLRFSALLPNTAIGRHDYESIRRGDVDGMSFSFNVAAGGERRTKTTDGKPLRELRDINVHELSVVAFPAYSRTSVDVMADNNFAEQKSSPRIGTGEAALIARGLRPGLTVHEATARIRRREQAIRRLCG